MADSPSQISGALHADDSEAMVDAITALGARVEPDWAGGVLSVTPLVPGAQTADPVVRARLSGITARFLLPASATLGRRVVIDGAAPLRERPIAPLAEALRALGVDIDYLEAEGALPVAVDGSHLRGNKVEVEADYSSQFLSAMLLSAAKFPTGLQIQVPGSVVAEPFVDLTLHALRDFGVSVERTEGPGFTVAAQPIRGVDYVVEPDATSASYFFAAALITQGEVTVQGLGTASVQGDMGFLEVLERMGATVERHRDHTVVRGGPIRGIDVDLSQLPDTALTLAAVAVFADRPTRVRGVSYIRGHETDRISAVVTELGRLGINAHETSDGFSVEPGTPESAEVYTYGDHRMAMSFSLIGLRSPGISILHPEVVAKTYPRFFDDLELLRSDGEADDR